MNIYQLNSWFQKHFSNLVKELEDSNHHYSKDNQNIYHGEGNCWVHTEQVMLIAEIINASQNGAIAALLHDLGKPMTRQENHDKMRVSYYNHESVSGYMSLEVMEKLSQSTELSDQDKINIFFAICNHIDVHNILKECHLSNSFDPFIQRYQGQANMARILVELGISDALGRFTEKDKNMSLMTLLNRMEKEDVFSKMSQKPVIDKTKPTITLLIGIPCSGKSFFTKSIKDTVVLSMDDLLTENNTINYREAWGSKDRQRDASIAFDNNLKLAIKERKDIVIDKMNLVKSARNRLVSNTIDHVNKINHYNRKAVLILEELPVILARNELRTDKYISADSYKRMICEFTAPSFEDFDEIEVYYKGKKLGIN